LDSSSLDEEPVLLYWGAADFCLDGGALYCIFGLFHAFPRRIPGIVFSSSEIGPFLSVRYAFSDPGSTEVAKISEFFLSGKALCV